MIWIYGAAVILLAMGIGLAFYFRPAARQRRKDWKEFLLEVDGRLESIIRAREEFKAVYFNIHNSDQADNISRDMWACSYYMMKVVLPALQDKTGKELWFMRNEMEEEFHSRKITAFTDKLHELIKSKESAKSAAIN